MPVDAVSLYGFMAESEAVQYLEDACILEPGADPRALWAEAQAGLGEPTPNAGRPTIRAIPPELNRKLEAVAAEPWFQQFVADSPWRFALVEIAPLIAFQFQINVGHSDDQCASLGEPPGTSDMLNLCLPRQRTLPEFRLQLQPGAFVVSSADLNVSVTDALNAMIPPGSPLAGDTLAGPVIGTRVPTVQVARVNGRYYLRNGYHRVYCIGRKGGEYVPCVVLDFDSLEHAIGHGTNFRRELFESADPPTMAHYLEGRSAEVRMPRLQKVITVSWTEATLREDS